MLNLPSDAVSSVSEFDSLLVTDWFELFFVNFEVESEFEDWSGL